MLGKPFELICNLFFEITSSNYIKNIHYMLFAGENMPRSFGEDYDNHVIFTHLKTIMRFYETLSWSNYSPVDFAGVLSKSKVLNISTYVYSSLAGTIESIFVLLQNGRCNDAMALVRKYSDTIILDIYLRILISELNDKVLSESTLQNIINNDVSKWIDSDGRLFDEKKIMKIYSKIENSYPELTSLFKLKDSNAVYHKLRNVCNDNMHNNYLYTLIANDAEIIRARKDIRSTMIKNISASVRYFFSIHYAFIYSAECAFFMSSDYIDYLECGQQPPEGSERWVAPSVQEAFNIVKITESEVAKYLYNLDLMDLEM